MKTLQVKSVLCGFSVLAVTLAPQAQAAHKRAGHSMSMKRAQEKRAQEQMIAIEAWPGQRVMLVLPLALGANWNADPALGHALLLDGESNLERALQQTGKLSVLQLQRNNPVFQRALQDKVVTNDDLMTWAPVDAPPSLDSARQALGKLQSSFTQAPLIGEFAVEEIRSSGEMRRPSVQVQVSGRMYDGTNVVPLKNISVTSNPVSSGRDTLKAIRLATNNAFQQVAAQLTSPIMITNLPSGEGATMPAMGGNTAPAAHGTVVTTPAQPTKPVAPTLPNNTAPATLPPAIPVPGGTESPAPVTPAPATPVETTPPAAAPESPAPTTPAPTAPAIQQQ